MRFESFDFAPEILRAVSECGYQEMTPVQQQAIPTIRRGSAKAAVLPVPVWALASTSLPRRRRLSTAGKRHPSPRVRR